jgi:hypothetical protein
MAKRDHGARVRRDRAMAAQARQRRFVGEMAVDAEAPDLRWLTDLGERSARRARSPNATSQSRRFREERWICTSLWISCVGRAIEIAEDTRPKEQP